MTDPDRQERIPDIGPLRGKFDVFKDGEPIVDCFVLRPLDDPAARMAVLAYADACEDEAPKLAENIRQAWSE